MKILIRNIIVGMFCGLVLLPIACTNLDEFDSSKLANPVILSVVVSQVKDSTARITATNPSDGYITLGLLEDPGVEIELDPEAFFTHNYQGITFVTVKARKNVSVGIDFDELVQYTDYVVYGVSSNTDGVIGNLVRLSFSTSDSHAPKLKATSPAVDKQALPLTGELVLLFDEPVTYDSTKLLQYYFYYDDVTVKNQALNVTVEGSMVTITSDSMPRNNEFVFVSWAEGAFLDASDNLVKAKSSNFDEDGYPYGLFFSTEWKDFQPTIVPADGDTVSIAEMATIELTFDEPVVGFHKDYSTGGALSYEDKDGDVVTKVLKRSDFSITTGNTVTLTAPLAAVSTQTITLKLKASTFEVGLYNVNAAIEASWVVE